MTIAAPLVMIHGLMGSLAYFSPAARLPDIVVHTPDLIGYGARRDDARAPTVTLAQQANAVLEYLSERVEAPCWLLGHSVGGAVAMLAASAAPERVCGIISVEGNFTLDDAFWCRKIAALTAVQWEAEHREMLADTKRWLTGSDIEPTPDALAWGEAILHNQPPATIAAMARAVVAETGVPAYLERVRGLVAQGVPIHLIAGARSAAGWNVPQWVRAAAASDIVLSDTGHMMMLEAPDRFCAAVHAMIAG